MTIKNDKVHYFSNIFLDLKMLNRILPYAIRNNIILNSSSEVKLPISINVYNYDCFVDQMSLIQYIENARLVLNIAPIFPARLRQSKIFRFSGRILVFYISYHFNG